MDKKEILTAAKELMLAKPVAYLSTIDEKGYPYVTAVFNLRDKKAFPVEAEALEAYDNDYTNIYISTNTSSMKVKNITKNNKVSIYYCIPEVFKGMQFQGTVEIVDNLQLKKDMWTEESKRYYPLGYTDPDYTILKIKTTFINSWYQSGKHKIHLEDEK